jgi:hypothetical protein
MLLDLQQENQRFGNICPARLLHGYCPSVWFMWRDRDDIVFEGAAPSPFAVIRLIRRKVGLWKAAALVDRWRLSK